MNSTPFFWQLSVLVVALLFTHRAWAQSERTGRQYLFSPQAKQKEAPRRMVVPTVRFGAGVTPLFGEANAQYQFDVGVLINQSWRVALATGYNGPSATQTVPFELFRVEQNAGTGFPVGQTPIGDTSLPAVLSVSRIGLSISYMPQPQHLIHPILGVNVGFLSTDYFLTGQGFSYGDSLSVGIRERQDFLFVEPEVGLALNASRYIRPVATAGMRFGLGTGDDVISAEQLTQPYLNLGIEVGYFGSREERPSWMRWRDRRAARTLSRGDA